MNKFECISPFKHPNSHLSDIPFRCGRCEACMARRRMEWANRMMLEQYGKTYKPYFVTLTYRPGELPKNYKESTREVQLYLKRLRRKLYTPIRYFCATENGDKKGRIHNHLILWNLELAKMNLVQQWKIQFDTWGHGRLESKPVRSPAAFSYTAKYMVKNMKIIMSKSREDYEGNIRKPHKIPQKMEGRLFTYSQRPILGSSGIERWKQLITKMNEQNKWSKINQFPPNFINAPIFNKLTRLYIPSDVYKVTCKELGLSFVNKESDILPIDDIQEITCQKELIEMPEEIRLLGKLAMKK